ncbi:MAG TPA: hypothetical protein VHT92_06820 [Candidatus Cybelea sp.]|jgi:hypothetical protein|nr:hypothetical protein [Candidatus Cybelea sp.]
MFGPTSRVILSERSESKGRDGESEEADKQERFRDGARDERFHNLASRR